MRIGVGNSRQFGTTPPGNPRWAVWCASLLVLLAASGAAGAPVRLIVKYRPVVDACAHCLVAHGVPFQTLTGTPSLDALNQQLGVTAARALFYQHHTRKRGRSGAWAADVDRIRQRFATRTLRAPFGAEVPDLSRTYVLELAPGMSAESAAAAYASDPAVEWAQPDREVHATFTPNDTLFAQQYALALIGAPTAWDTARGTGALIAINDTGVDYLHADLAANMWVNPGEVPGNGVDDDGNGYVDDVHGWDFFDDDDDPFDENFHGSHCAGIAAAAGDNGQGVAGLAFGARIMATRGLGAGGFGSTSDLAAGIVYAAENGADVVSNSWGGYNGEEPVARDAVLTADALGVVVVAAAGNDADTTDGFGLAPYPSVITVAATDQNDHVASFSNHGDAVSVSAPGVNVLSVCASVAGGGYCGLSGTSMATPYVAGLAGLLLSVAPTLTPSQVRTAIEANAHPIVQPGFEGQRWNPYYGWGRIDAARVFDPPQALTRISIPPGPAHGFADSVGDSTFTADIGFTSFDPLDWTLVTPPWIAPSATSGSGAAEVSLSLDLTGRAPGPLAAQLAVEAPDADDGGAEQPIAVRVHRDDRTAPETQVATGLGYLQADPPKVASNGFATLAAWVAPYTLLRQVSVARIENDGSAGAVVPLQVSPFGYPIRLDIASDGRDFLVVWGVSSTSKPETLYAQRVDAHGAALEPTPTIFYESAVQGRYLETVKVAWDGTAYVILWTEVTFDPTTTTVRWRRMLRDGSLGKTATLWSDRAPTYPEVLDPAQQRLACYAGECLVAWEEGSNDFNDFGERLNPLYGMRLKGERPLDPAPVLLLAGVDGVPLMAADADGYLIVIARPYFGNGTWVAAFRVPRNFLPGLAPVTHRIDRNVPNEAVDKVPVGLAFDGTDYIVTFQKSSTRTGLFAARVTPASNPLDSEAPGLLVSGKRTTRSGAIAAGWRDSVVVWRDRRLSVTQDAIYAQRLLAHAPTSVGPTLAIGAIGPQAVAEEDVLVFTLSAPGLDPSATFTATGLPPGAEFDPFTRTFHFVPAADQAGVLAPIHFEATDGSQTVAEDVVVTVSEAHLSLSGTVYNSQHVPLAGIALRLRGSHGTRRAIRTDAAGAYRFLDLPPGKHRVQLDGEDRRRYRVQRPKVRASLLDADRHNADMTIVAR